MKHMLTHEKDLGDRQIAILEVQTLVDGFSWKATKEQQLYASIMTETGEYTDRRLLSLSNSGILLESLATAYDQAILALKNMGVDSNGFVPPLP